MEKAGNPKEAAAVYQNAISLDDTFIPAYINLGAVYLNHLNKPREALDIYHRALDKAPENPKIHNNFGVTFMALRDYERAEQELIRASELDPKFLDPLYNLACLFSQKGETATALSWLKKAHALGGEEIIHWASKDQDLVGLHKLQEYQEFLRTALPDQGKIRK